ncbi:uncharacterized protein isoform X2 [Choristoneura fumiferana]
MQSIKKPVDRKSKSKEKPKEELKVQEEKLKKNTYNVSTPREYMQRSSAADVYAQKRKSAVQKTPKKIPGTSNESKASPMKDLLKSSPSSISQISNSSKVSSSIKTINKVSQSNARARTAKDLPFVNVTVNSPIAKRKLNLTTESARVKESAIRKSVEKRLNAKDAEKQNTTMRLKKELPNDRGDFERQRSKTRTLDENEVKLLTPDGVDNNEGMINLKQRLIAHPKAFYIDLDGDTAKAKNDKTSDEEVSYEDDFESYESDFDSYHSDRTSENTSEDVEHDDIDVDKGDVEKHSLETADLKEGKDEGNDESMLDSGSFDLREQRSANKSKPVAMEFITEASEDTEDKVSSLDEGFQEGSSAVSSMRTVHVDVLERPLFIDFKKSKVKKRKKRIFEELMQRAKDILSMVTLHEMSFVLCEMKPISYDLYMAIFGRTNSTQIAVQTFEDGITEEVQTDEVAMDYKWTQFPVKFSKFDVYLNNINVQRKNRRNSDDFFSKFNSLLDEKADNGCHNDLDTLEKYKENPLRVLLEQKDGVGNCEMLPYDTYSKKLSNDFSINQLGKFLKKVESRVSHVLNTNTHGLGSENVVKSSLPFSSGYVAITTKNVSDEKSFLKSAKITGVIFSENKHNLILTVHMKPASGIVAGKCILCLWDVSVARAEPIKILIAIDNVVMGRFRGATDGILVAALEDGSTHLWDLSEQPAWRNDVTSSKKENLKDVKDGAMTQTERDREWNLKNINAGYEQLPLPFALQACAYTSSAASLDGNKMADCTVGLEYVGEALAQDGGRKVVGQVCSLQRLGVLTIWTIVQEKTKTHDLGKAFWSKMKLEKTQTFSLTDHVNAKELIDNSTFNLSAAKKRMVNRKKEKTLARNFSRQNSADIRQNDRPASVASARRLPAEKTVPHEWETGIVCNNLKIVHYDNTDRYLVAKNNGEVLSCTKSLGAFTVDRLCVSSDTSSITCLDVSPHASAYFLAATDSGTVHLYSMLEARVLLTLDCSVTCNQLPRDLQPRADSGEVYLCLSVGTKMLVIAGRRNASSQDARERPLADIKGRFVSDVPRRHSHVGSETEVAKKVSVLSVLWSRVNPCRMLSLSRTGALALWELTQSDIHPQYVGGRATFACMAGDGTLALVTPEGDVQVHRMHQQRTADHLQLFHKYVALL